MIKQSTSKYLLVLISLLLAGPNAVAIQEPSVGISVDGGYIRQMPPGQILTAAFVSLKNTTKNTCRLLGASSAIAGKIQIHGHFHKDGMMSMRPVKGIDIAAGKTISLQPGGYHLMLFGLKHDLIENQLHQITLLFDKCPDVVFNANVKNMSHHKNHD